MVGLPCMLVIVPFTSFLTIQDMHQNGWGGWILGKILLLWFLFSYFERRDKAD